MTLGHMMSGVSKQERLPEIPTSTNTIADGNVFAGVQEPFTALPGSEFDHPAHPSRQVLSMFFFRVFSSLCLDTVLMYIYARAQNSFRASDLQIRVGLQMLGMRYKILQCLFFREESMPGFNQIWMVN